MVMVYYCGCIFFPASLAIPPRIGSASVSRIVVTNDSRRAIAMYNNAETWVFDCDSQPLGWAALPTLSTLSTLSPSLSGRCTCLPIPVCFKILISVNIMSAGKQLSGS